MAGNMKIALLIESARACERRFIRGVARFAGLEGNWTFYRKPKYYMKLKTGFSVSDVREFRPDGIIVSDTENTEQLLKLGVPTIIHTIKRTYSGLPNIVGDTQQCGRMAAEHLLERGFTNFAYCGYKGFYWSRGRYESFRKRIEQAGYNVSYYELDTINLARNFDSELAKLTEWITQTPRPVGIMTCADDCSQTILEACQSIGLHVPEQAAIVGVDNDDMVCELSNPPLSSISLNFEKAGFEAAQMLKRIMSGQDAADEQITVLPTHVVMRQSSNILAIEDQDVAGALKFIRENAKGNIQTEDVLNAVGCSRRHLHEKFRKTIGRSVHREIKHTRTELIARMLIETDLTISQIAREFGFSDVDHIARYFRDEKGMGLLAYRKRYGIK